MRKPGPICSRRSCSRERRIRDRWPTVIGHKHTKTRSGPDLVSCFRAFVAIIAMTFQVGASPGHRPVQPPAFRSQTDLVALAVTVVDADGRPVLGLGKDAFSLTEDDRPQPIAQFTGDPVPLSLAIALDASTSMKGRRFEYARDAVWRLLDHLAPEDEVCVYGFNDRPFVIAPWTSDVHTVERSLLGVSPDGNTALYAPVSSAFAAAKRSSIRLVSTCRTATATIRWIKARSAS